MTDAPAVVVACERVVGLILTHTSRFPRSSRFTFAARIDHAALDAAEALALARYAPRAEQRVHLAAADRALVRLRLLLRLAHGQRLLSVGALEAVMRDVDEVGRMTGGWLAACP